MKSPILSATDSSGRSGSRPALLWVSLVRRWRWMANPTSTIPLRSWCARASITPTAPAAAAWCPKTAGPGTAGPSARAAASPLTSSISAIATTWLMPGRRRNGRRARQQRPHHVDQDARPQIPRFRIQRRHRRRLIRRRRGLRCHRSVLLAGSHHWPAVAHLRDLLRLHPPGRARPQDGQPHRGQPGPSTSPSTWKPPT